MIRDDTFRISRRPYAVDLASLRVHTIEPDRQHAGPLLHRVIVDAVWFRRRRGATIATLGTLWDLQHDPAPTDTVEALARHVDGRYGGSWLARWDGHSYASENPQDFEATVAHLDILRPMLDNYPAAPAGYDAWWYFQPAGATP